MDKEFFEIANRLGAVSYTHLDATAKRLYREGGEPEKAELIGNKIEVPKGRARNRW